MTGRPRAICGQRYPLPCFAWLKIGMRGSRAAALKGMKSCRTQGDFSPSVHPSVSPPQALSGLKSALTGRKSALTGLELERAD